MDYTKTISETSKQSNFIQNKPMNEQIKQIIIEQLQKKRNQQNKLMNKKKKQNKTKSCTRKLNRLQFVHVNYKSQTLLNFWEHLTPLSKHVKHLNCRLEKSVNFQGFLSKISIYIHIHGDIYHHLYI